MRFFSILSLMFFGVVSLCQGQSRSFTCKPIYEILTKRNGNYLGTIRVELFPNIAPLHVSNFDSLVNVHYYDSTAFHRVIPGFMIQGGDPNSRHGDPITWGNGDPSQPTVNAEFSAAKHLRGILSAARDNNVNSANSQFFICVAASSWLNGQYSVYGRTLAGMDVVDTIVSAPRDSADRPFQKIEMFISYIGSNDTVPSTPVLNLPLNGSYGASTNRNLKWLAQSDGIIYLVEVATDSLFTNIVKSAKVGSNAHVVTGLSQSTKYYWRVKTNNGGHFSDYSPVWHFYVSGVGIEERNLAGTKVLVTPNPGNGVFVFNHVERGDQIEIYDPSGKLIQSLTAEGNEEPVDLSFVKPRRGIYFYKVKSKTGQLSEGKLVKE
jgi:cyclophilin family peptidyl-prolyl cis-trans isomerase